VESRPKHERNANVFQIERFYASTIDKKTRVERMRGQSNSHKDGNICIYKEGPPDMNSSNLYLYSIISKNANTNVGVIFLKQKPIYMVHSRYSDSEYQAKLLYMNASSLHSSLSGGVNPDLKRKSTARNNGDQNEAVYLAKRYEGIFGRNAFTNFKTGELFERPLQLLKQPLACVSVHEPLARPPVLSVIVQDPVDPRVSDVICIVI
jgi:hypothetical protein